MGDKLNKIRSLKTKEIHDARSSKKNLTKLSKGDRVLIQDPKSGRWVSKGTIQGIRDSGKSYEVESEGWTTIRSRKFLKRES